MRPPAAVLRLAVGLSVASPWAIAPSPTVGAIPDEPGAVVLPDAPLLQAVVADIDGDGSRELVRLIRGEAGSAHAEVWGFHGTGWERVGDPVEIVEPMELLAPNRIGPWVDRDGVSLRMFVHRAGATERVLVATQPPTFEVPCGCLTIRALHLEAAGPRLVPVAEPDGGVDGILVIDLDGDGTDELLTALSLPPLGDISYPTEARVYRWADGAFGAPTVTELPVGSGDTPIQIGDTDGRPGDEAAFVSTLGPPGLFRIVLGPNDALTVDRLRERVMNAVAVPMPNGRAIATASGASVSVRRWPAFAAPEEPAAAASVAGAAELLGAIELDGRWLLFVHEWPTNRVVVFGLPDLEPVELPGAFPRSASSAFDGLPVRPYLGPVPGWGPDGRAAILAHGMIAAPGASAAGGGIREAASLAGAEPIGPAGDGTWIAILHAPGGLPLRPLARDADGGPLTPLAPLEGAWLSLVPRDLVLVPDPPLHRFEVEIAGAHQQGGMGPTLIGRDGFTTTVEAPPGSRVMVTGLELEEGAPRAVPDSGVVRLRLRPPAERADPSATVRAALLITTPAGRGHVARWDVRALTGAPPLSVEVTTQLGSPEVSVSGETAAYASVTIDGQAVEVDSAGHFSAQVVSPPWPTEIGVEASDVAGNVAREVVTGVGLFDYRALPWVPIVAALVAAAAVLLYLRVPQRAVAGAGEEGSLEELDPD